MGNLTKNVVRRFQAAEFHIEAMSNLRPSTTGVDGAVIWISAGEFSGVDSQHGPRIKVVLGEKATTEGLRNSVSVSLSDPPMVLGDLPGSIRKKVFEFIKRNRETLLRHWNGELDSREALDLLKKV